MLGLTNLKVFVYPFNFNIQSSKLEIGNCFDKKATGGANHRSLEGLKMDDF